MAVYAIGDGSVPC